MKLIIGLFLLIQIPSFAKIKECFKDKQSDQMICYKRYFDRYKIHKTKDDERYFTASNGKLYAIKDTIEVKFNSVGAILTILDDFEIDFIDKTKGEKYIFKVRNKDQLFSMLRRLNSLSSVQKALPQREQKYTKEYIEYVRQKREEKLDKIKEDIADGKYDKKAAPKSGLSGGTQGFKFGR
jgi:hypothetical protein